MRYGKPYEEYYGFQTMSINFFECDSAEYRGTRVFRVACDAIEVVESPWETLTPHKIIENVSHQWM